MSNDMPKLENLNDLTDEQMACRIRMLMRNEIFHEAVVCAARDRIMLLRQQRADALAAIEHYLKYPSWDNEEVLRKIVSKEKVDAA